MPSIMASPEQMPSGKPIIPSIIMKNEEQHVPRSGDDQRRFEETANESVLEGNENKECLSTEADLLPQLAEERHLESTLNKLRVTHMGTNGAGNVEKQEDRPCYPKPCDLIFAHDREAGPLGVESPGTTSGDKNLVRGKNGILGIDCKFSSELAVNDEISALSKPPGSTTNLSLGNGGIKSETTYSRNDRDGVHNRPAKYTFQRKHKREVVTKQKGNLVREENVLKGIKPSFPKTSSTHNMEKHKQVRSCSFRVQIYSLQRKISRPNGLKEEEEQQLGEILMDFKDEFKDLPQSFPPNRGKEQHSTGYWINGVRFMGDIEQFFQMSTDRCHPVSRSPNCVHRSLPPSESFATCPATIPTGFQIALLQQNDTSEMQ
eukprot:Gb_22290 [translate_table: standard]